MCVNAAVFFTTAFLISFKATNTMCIDLSIQQALLFHPYICRNWATDSYLQLHSVVAQCRQLQTAVVFSGS